MSFNDYAKSENLLTALIRNMESALAEHDSAIFVKEMVGVQTVLVLLRKRSVIETVNDELKNTCQIEHTRHRSVDNFATNLFAGLIAYNLLPQKPSMNIEIIDKSRLIA